jgi:OOP family OmpA-OmpF porin
LFIRLFVIGLAVAILQPTLGFAQTANSESKTVTARGLDGPYAFGAIGADYRGRSLSTTKITEINTAPGGVGSFGLGWRFGDGLRAEFEGSYRSAAIKSISTLRVNGALLPLSDQSGSLTTAAVMANVKYDIPIPDFGLPVRPYIGGGLGYASLRFANAIGYEPFIFHLPYDSTFSGPAVVSFGSADALAYKAVAGAAAPLAFAPGLEATLEYAYFGTARADFAKSAVTTSSTLINGAVPSAVARNGFVLHDQSVMLGLRYYFGAPSKSGVN